MKKAIVTGATGFIGKFLVRELVKQNVEVIAVVRRGTKNLNTINALPVKIVECNIADYHMLPDMIADRDIDVVFHIAWQGVSDLDARNEAIQMQNLQSTLDLIDAMHIMRIGSFVPMPDMKELTGQEIDTRRWNISTFGRLYMASALPETVHKVLNIDCDTIIVDTIEPLWNTDMTGKVFGGMLECINDRYRRNVGKNDGDYYLNGGIVFLNLDEVRVGNYERKFTDYITKYGSSLAYLDQDVLNGVVEQEKKVKLPMRYNTLSIYFYATYEQVLKIRRSKSQDFYSKEEFSEAISNPGLVHFTTCFLDGLRPWIKGNQHPYLKTFLKYKEMSPWRDIPLQEDKRSGLVKFRTTMIRKAPRFVLCEVASVLHGVIIPEKNYKRMQERVKECSWRGHLCY